MERKRWAEALASPKDESENPGAMGATMTDMLSSPLTGALERLDMGVKGEDEEAPMLILS